MTWKMWMWTGLGLLTLVALGVPVEAATSRAIPGITNAATQVADTIKTIGYLIAPVLIIVAVYEARQHAGFGLMFSLVGVIIVVGVIVFADDIVGTIRPGQAQTVAEVVVPTGMVLELWVELALNVVTLGSVVEGMRRVRRARRV